MPYFIRRLPEINCGKDHTLHRPQLRIDFRYCCTHCRVHEHRGAGKEDYEIDHFRPKGKPEFEHLEFEYSNLYWSCHVCNNNKGSYWPNPKELVNGYYFVDICSEEWDLHYRVEPDGELIPLTNAAGFTADRLRLNRDHLKDLRAECMLAGLDWSSPKFGYAV